MLSIEAANEVSPALHQLPALLDECGAGIGSLDGTADFVRQCMLADVERRRIRNRHLAAADRPSRGVSPAPASTGAWNVGSAVGRTHAALGELMAGFDAKCKWKCIAAQAPPITQASRCSPEGRMPVATCRIFFGDVPKMTCMYSPQSPSAGLQGNLSGCQDGMAAVPSEAESRRSSALGQRAISPTICLFTAQTTQHPKRGCLLDEKFDRLASGSGQSRPPSRARPYPIRQCRVGI